MPATGGSLTEIAIQTAPDVWHCRERSSLVARSVIEELKSLAESSDRKRCRLCLHVSPDDIDQQMLIVMHREAQDRPHYHPAKDETIFPVEGLADLIIIEALRGTKSVTTLVPGKVFSVTNEVGVVHYLEVLSNWFVFLEVCRGPFLTTSTVYS